MNKVIGIDERMKQFRLASRELFNHYFCVPEPYDNDGWILEERFSDVQVLLFEKLVLEPEDLPAIAYGSVQNKLLVELTNSESAPIMINRDIDSGYWDYPIKEFTKDTRLLFISFFDWDQLNYRDNRYVRVQIDRCVTHPDIVGKHALVESQYVRFVKG